MDPKNNEARTFKRFLKFWGTRGSCAVSSLEQVQFGGNTSCLEIVYEEAKLIIDAGTGIRPLGLDLWDKKEKSFNLFFSHAHLDHLLGFPFFEPLHHKESTLHLWLPKGTVQTGHELIKTLLSSDFFPVRLEEIEAKIELHTTEPGKSVRIKELLLEVYPTHHPGSTHGFKLLTPHQVIGYVTDNELFQGYHGPSKVLPKEIIAPYQGLIDFFSGCDLLIHEAQYTEADYKKKVGWGHSSLANAIAFIELVKPKQWLVTHHDPSYTDKMLQGMEKIAQEALPNCPVSWAKDQMVWNLL